MLATARSSRLSNMVIEKAGLLDPTALLYSPALRIDYNIHTVERLHVRDNTATGIEILANDVYANAKVAHSVLSNNFGNGITTRGSFFELAFCELEGNSHAGFEYNPHYTAEEALQLRQGIHDPWVMQDLNGNSRKVADAGIQFLITEQQQHAAMYEVEFYVSVGYYIVVDVLDWNPVVDQEKVTIYDGARDSIQQSSHKWQIEEDLVDFPIHSAGTKLTFRWSVISVSSGRLTFVLRSSKCLCHKASMR